MPHLPHNGGLAAQDVRRRFLAAESKRIGQGGRYEGTVGTGESGSRTGKMLLSYSFGPIDAIPHLNGIQIYLHDAMLVPQEFYQDGEIRFKTLAHPGALWPEKHILGCLLGDGASSAITLSAGSLGHSIAYLLEIKTSVVKESLILTGHHRHRHIDGHGIQRHPMMLELDLLSPTHLLYAADDHQRSHIYRYPAVQ